MNRRTASFLFIYLIVGIGMVSPLIQAQTTPKPTAAAPTQADERPPDQKAFMEAVRMTDPQKKLQALDSFIATYPKSSSLRNAQQEALTLLIQKQPEQKVKILARAKQLLSGTTGSTQSRYCNAVASALVDAGIYLNTAAAYARNGLKASPPKQYLAEQRADYLKRKQTVPEESTLIKRHRAMLSAYKATLGRIYLQQGKNREAEALLREAYRDSSSPDSATLVALAELAEKKGQKSEALDYLLKSRLTGRMSAEGRRKLAGLYREIHPDSADDLEKALDAKYDQLYPNPVKFEKYGPIASRSNRIVLAELYTGSGCPPCTGADLAFDAALERYSRQELAVVVYHLHIPRPDPMTNPDTVARSKQYSVRGTPSYAIDGKLSVGGGDREESNKFFEERIRKQVDKRLEEPVQAQLSLKAALEGRIVKVKSAVDDLKSTSPDLKLQIALVENHIRYSGENGIRYHAMVVRSLAGYKLESGKPASWEHSFDLDKISNDLKEYLDQFENNNERFGKFSFSEKKYQVHAEHLGVVAFLEDEKEKSILQAIHFTLPSQPEGKPGE